MILELKKYIKSRQIRFVYDYPIIPLAYIKMCKPNLKRHGPNKYTVEERSYIHKNQQSVLEWKLQWLRKNPVINQRASIEYNDNRIALYIAQKGKCAVSDVEMFLDEIHCHHKHYWSKRRDDSYKNLILVTKNIHELIHMKDNEKIKERIDSLGLSENQIKKLNKLRKLIKNIEIPINPKNM